MSIDVVIPLSNESQFDNLELRLALRSIEQNVQNLGKIHLVTLFEPNWIQNVNIIPVADTYTDNKDANLFVKILKACQDDKVSEQFFFWSDDQIVLHPIDYATLPISFNCRSEQDFNGNNRWSRRMINTFKYLRSKEIYLKHNYDSHVPQIFDKFSFYHLIRNTPFNVLPGFCINTLYFGLLHSDKPEEDLRQHKASYESRVPVTALDLDKKFIGYNESGFLFGVKELLSQLFSRPSSFEKKE